MTISTTDQGALNDTDTVTINLQSTSPATLSTGTDTVFFASGTNQVNATNTTATNGDKITGGSGTDTLTIDTAKNADLNVTFGDGSHSDIKLSNFEKIVLTDAGNGNGSQITGNI